MSEKSFASQWWTVVLRLASLTLRLCGVRAPGGAQRCVITVTMDTITLDGTTCPCVLLLDGGRHRRCAVKVQCQQLRLVCSSSPPGLREGPCHTVVSWLSHGCHMVVSWWLVPVVETSCGRPPILESAERVWDGKSSPGSVAFYLCKEGFRNAGGQNESACEENAQWTRPSLSCRGNSANQTNNGCQAEPPKHSLYFEISFQTVCVTSCPRGVMWGSCNTASHWAGVEWQLHPWKHRLLLL